jgi:hypothetical protein
VLAMFTVSECGNWLSNETLMEECADRTTFADELSRKRSEAGKKGSAARWSADGKPDGKTCSKTVANQDLPSPNVPSANDLMANAWHKREEKKRNDKNADKTIEVAHWKCVDLGLGSPRWSRPNDAMNAFDAALQNEQRATPHKALTEIADELGQLWLDYTRSAKGSGQFAMGPVKFFGEGWYRRTAAWRDSSTEETQSLDGSAFIEAKRKKRASASAADDRRQAVIAAASERT